MSVIPGGCTRILQPLDVFINKEYFLGKYDDWFHQGMFEYTAEGNMKSPSHSSSRLSGTYKCNWAPKDVVIKSFNVCGITQDDFAKISATLN